MCGLSRRFVQRVFAFEILKIIKSIDLNLKLSPRKSYFMPLDCHFKYLIGGHRRTKTKTIVDEFVLI